MFTLASHLTVEWVILIALWPPDFGLYGQKVLVQKITRTKSNWTKSIAHLDKKVFYVFILKQIGIYVSTNIKNTFYINIYNFFHIYHLSNIT